MKNVVASPPLDDSRREEGDPFASVLSLGHKWDSGFSVALVAAFLVHFALAIRAALVPVELIQWAQWISVRIHEKVWVSTDIEVLKEPEPPPPPPPAPEKEEAPKEAPPPPAPLPPKAAEAKPVKAPEPPAPAAARAGAVLTSDPDPNEPVDLTNSFVSGSGSTFAGGVTQAGGTSNAPVYNRNARAEGVPGGTGTAPAAPAVDLSRPAICGKEGNWQCSTPAEALAAQVEEAAVIVQAVVRSDGTVASVTVLDDPGYGYGREAKRCVMARKCDPALDRAGRPIDGPSKKLRIVFSPD